MVNDLERYEGSHNPEQLSMGLENLGQDTDLEERYAAEILAEAQPVTPKRPSAFDRFTRDQTILDQIRLDSGLNPLMVTEKSQEALVGFRRASRSDQVSLYREVMQDIDVALDGRFTTASRLATSLHEEEGKAGLIDDVWDWNTFKNVSRTDRLSIVRDIEAENRRKLLTRFDSYLMQWRKHLFNLGKSPEEVETEIDKLEDEFLGASEKGQIGIARNLREKLATTSSTEFFTLLSVWETLSDPKRFTTEEDRLLLSRKDWQKAYDTAHTPQDKRKVTDNLNRQIEQLLEARATGKPIPLN